MHSKTMDLFANAPIHKAVFANAIPAIISMIMVLIYNLADTFFIGQTGNPYMVAAVSVVTPVFLIFLAIGVLFGIGGTSLISRKLGEGDFQAAKRVSSFCFWTGLAIGILGMIGLFCFSGPICRLVGTSEETFEYAKQYLQIVAFGAPFLIVSNSFSNIIRAEGKAKVAMTGMILGNIVNIILDPVLILGFHWNVAGAAIATVVGNVVAALFYIYNIYAKESLLSLSLKDFDYRNKIAIGVLAIGIPASLNNLLMSFSNIAINNLMNSHGDMAVAGLGVAMKVNMIAVMLLIGLGTGIQPLLGYCYGAANKKRFREALRFSLIFAFGLSLVMSGICYLGAKPMVNAFLNATSEAGIYGITFSRILIASGPILGLLFVFINAIQSLGAAVPALILSVSRQGLIYLPVLFTANALFHSPNALVMAQPITDYMGLTLAIILFILSFHKYFDLKQQELTEENSGCVKTA
jgi:putative MATE family efflux protein